MKNYVTPRTMNASHINPDMDPIERQIRNDKNDMIVLVGCTLAAIAAFAIIVIWG